MNIEGGHGATKVNSTAPYDGSDAGRKPDDGWLGVVFNGADSPNRRLITTFAVCAGRGKYRYVEEEVPLLTAENVTRIVPCPDGMFVIGGGVSMSPRNAFTHISQTRPWDSGDGDSVPSNGWLASVSLSGPKDGSMRTVAICTPPVGDLVYEEGFQILTSDGFAIAHTVQCDPGFQVTGGGVIHDGGYDISLHSSEPFDGDDVDLRRDNGWTAKLSNPNDEYFMSAFAVCIGDT